MTFYRDDYLEKNEEDGKTYVYYDAFGQLVMRHLGAKDLDKKAIVDQPDKVPDIFPFFWVGAHYVKDGQVYDHRIKGYEYAMDMTAQPPALIRRDYLKEKASLALVFDQVKETVLSHLKKIYTDLASKSDSIAMEYYKKSLLPEYNMKVDAASVALLKEYPNLTRKYKETKDWLTNATIDQLEDGPILDAFIEKVLGILNSTTLEA